MAMSQDAFNWNDVAYEMAPISQYSDFYSNQPRIYMFEGATLLDLVILLATAALTLFWLCYLLKSDSGLTKALMTCTVSQIFVNLCIRIFKTFILKFIEYPQFSWLFIASSVETTFHYTLYLQYTSSVLLYVLLREKEIKSAWALFYYLPSILISVLVSTLNVNFNKLLFSIPFYGYVLFYVGMAASNVLILVVVLSSCTKFAREKLSIRCRLFLFVLTAAPPTLFNTVINVMDLLFMVVGVTAQFPIPYIIMTTYRYKAFELTPVFIMVAFFALLPDLRRSAPSKTVNSAEVTALAPPTSPTTPPSSTISTVSGSPSVPSTVNVHQEEVPIPNQVPLNYSNPHGSLLVHIQPVS